jgi:hypothetical protein
MARLPPPVDHQFKKGNKGKPKGTLNIKTRMIKALLRKVEYPDLSKDHIDGQQPPTITGPVVNYMIESLIKQAIKGNMKAFEILLDRTEGKVDEKPSDDEPDDPISEIRINIIRPTVEEIEEAEKKL